MATRQLLAALAEQFRQRSGVDIALESVGGVDAARRIEAGEDWDVAVLADAQIDRLTAAGWLSPESRTAVARSDVAIAVRAGAAVPDVGTESGLRDALVAARSVAYSTGPSGTGLLALIDRWGLGETLRPKLVQAQPGVPVADLVARGDAAIGLQQLSELQGAPGIAVAGCMPPGAEIVTIFAAARGMRCSRPDDAQKFLRFLAADETAPAKVRFGMSPARSDSRSS